MNKCYLYSRVSTQQQDGDAQRLGLQKAAQRYTNYSHIWITDTVSGSTPWRERKLAEVLTDCKDGDILIASEISRIGRNTGDVLDFLACATEKKLVVHIEKTNLTIAEDMQSKIIVTIMALAAEIERDFIRSRTREGMAKAKAAGKKIGRKTGPVQHHTLDIHADKIRHYLEIKLNKVAICKLLQCSIRNLNTHLLRHPQSNILSKQVPLL
jgi:DNA invertase Pin-like site-specific DNA recombinase